MAKSVSGSLGLLVGAIVMAISYWVALNREGDAGSEALAGFRLDDATGFAFPLEQSFQVGKQMTLLGVGTRKKAILNIYSVGFYGSKPVVKALNADQSSSSNCETIVNAKGAKAAQLTFQMGLNAEKMAEALTNIDGVETSIKDAFGKMIMEGIGGKLKKGESMTLEWKFPNLIVATARGTSIGEMKDKNLYQGLLNVYLGPKSVSPSLKQDMQC
mmetsp:Transcript_28313/g.51618  ORF Transcript_28313/g.51618 Transcript_28313/m.51618 type:complete len:215 (-) Transcript_28313:108-752(-)|eukprot:CAMPEP_0198302852 /NCGR_PEP_ID=MMETSP1449-20131203/56581_1 /TAXON_ID=420275 /ORGANISM="Attheya septentrionalis, Strain CCMP2084" /LENGTH=214 /DNA_ID=CAMNT_0044005323 /DNA_START=174 /DNA_END=818 /DNA_ORIENTATION=-